MPSLKHTTKSQKLLSLRSTRQRNQTNKDPSAAAIVREGMPERYTAALSWRDNGNQAPRLTEARARELTAEILKEHDDDKIVMDLIELVTGIAYDPVACDRDSLAFVSTREAVMFAPAFSRAISSFATDAAMRGVRATVSAVASERPLVSPIFAKGGAKLGRDAARAAGRLCADYTVTLQSATYAFEEAMIAETLRFYPKGGHDAALHLGITVGQFGKLRRRVERRQRSKANGGAATEPKPKGRR